MSQSPPRLGVYLHLARASDARQRALVRDKFLLLAAVSASRAGHSQIAGYCRNEILTHNPGHLVRRFSSIEEALADEDFLLYYGQLERTYPLEKAEFMLDSLGIQIGRERETYNSELEYAAALLGTTTELLEKFGAEGSHESIAVSTATEEPLEDIETLSPLDEAAPLEDFSNFIGDDDDDPPIPSDDDASGFGFQSGPGGTFELDEVSEFDTLEMKAHDTPEAPRSKDLGPASSIDSEDSVWGESLAPGLARSGLFGPKLDSSQNGTGNERGASPSAILRGMSADAGRLTDGPDPSEGGPPSSLSLNRTLFTTPAGESFAPPPRTSKPFKLNWELPAVIGIGLFAFVGGMLILSLLIGPFAIKW